MFSANYEAPNVWLSRLAGLARRSTLLERSQVGFNQLLHDLWGFHPLAY